MKIGFPGGPQTLRVTSSEVIAGCQFGIKKKWQL